MRLLTDVADFSDFRLGPTMELGRSMMSAGAGASYGVIDNRSENLQH